MRVYVLIRSDPNYVITLGVFASPQAAQRYVQEMSPCDHVAWQPPRAGRRWWQLETGIFTYTIDEHDVRSLDDIRQQMLGRDGELPPDNGEYSPEVHH